MALNDDFVTLKSCQLEEYIDPYDCVRNQMRYYETFELVYEIGSTWRHYI